MEPDQFSGSMLDRKATLLPKKLAQALTRLYLSLKLDLRSNAIGLRGCDSSVSSARHASEADMLLSYISWRSAKEHVSHGWLLSAVGVPSSLALEAHSPSVLALGSYSKRVRPLKC